jgi:LmbE family N-acetylglucosaminyl deacetylase
VATVVFFHAHPDDESIISGGTMASLSDLGHRVVLVTATRGELGVEPDGLLRPGESLEERRTGELAEACRILGVHRQVFLGYLDSGMAGEPSNDRPGCFAAADVDQAAADLAGILDEEGADVLVVYDEHGGYGHPDHVQVHTVGMRAADVAATAVVFLCTINRDYLRDLARWAADSGLVLPEGGPEDFDTMGEPGDRMTTEIDVSPWIERKREAMRAHASQISETSFFLSLSDEAFLAVWGREWYIRVRPPVPAGRPLASSLLPEEPTADRGGGGEAG